MNREEYRSLLGRLPIKSPTPQDMAMLCPHLTPEKAVRELTNGSGYVACPPLRVRGALQLISYYPERVEEIRVNTASNGEVRLVTTGTKNHPAELSLSHTARTAGSYADGKWRQDCQSQYACTDEAIRFAEESWGDDLILDSWSSVLHICLQDPSDLVNDRYHRDSPRTKALLTLALSRDFHRVVNDHSAPKSEQLDEAIVDMTIDYRVSMELVGGRGGYNQYNCAFCADGLCLSRCPGCNHRFRDNQFRSGWSTPLSRKMVAFLCEKGHVFKQDPEIAWAKERERWEELQRRIRSESRQ